MAKVVHRAWERSVALRRVGCGSGGAAAAAPQSSGGYARGLRHADGSPRMPLVEGKQPHRDHVSDQSVFNALVAQSLSRKDMKKSSDAKAAVTAEKDKLLNRAVPAWDVSSVEDGQLSRSALKIQKVTSKSMWDASSPSVW